MKHSNDISLKILSDLHWHVRLDASVDPVLGVVAPDWYHARALAVMALNVEMHRLHVEQVAYATLDSCFPTGRVLPPVGVA